MPENTAFLAERLRVEGEKTHLFFAGLCPSQWQLTVYSDGEVWTVRNVLSHFITAEEGFLQIFREICSGGNGVSEHFDFDRYNAIQQTKTKDLTIAELLDGFKSVRSQMILLVISMGDEDLVRKGRHPYLGITSLREMIKMLYRHNQIHYRDLRKLLE